MPKQANNAVHQTINDEPGFQFINRGYNSVFRPKHLSLGLVVPLETYSQGPAPTMTRHLERVQLAEQLGVFRRLVARRAVQRALVRRCGSDVRPLRLE